MRLRLERLAVCLLPLIGGHAFAQSSVSPGEILQSLTGASGAAQAVAIDVNAIREKQQTNVRAASADETVRLVPAKLLSLEEALEHVREDECVEITPEAVRLRKVQLDAIE